MSTDHHVNCSRLRKLCKEQADLVLDGFHPYKIELPPTIHQLYDHLAEKIGDKTGKTDTINTSFMYISTHFRGEWRKRAQRYFRRKLGIDAQGTRP